MGGLRYRLLSTAAGGVLTLGLSPLAATNAYAVTYQVGDYTISLQSTVGYTVGLRTAPVNNELAGLNNDDGDRNFRSGVMANRFQSLEQLGIVDGDYGFRASALAYIDTVYLGHNKNNSPDTFNTSTSGTTGFPSQTVSLEGRRFEPLAAFIYGAEYFNSGSDKLSWQIGRQTITWGESLFSTDGISGLQAPSDFYQGELLPNPLAQATFLPTGAASATYSFANGITLAGYWQFEYEPSTLPGVGSFFSTSDIVGPGAQRLLLGPVSNQVAVNGALTRARDIRPPNGLDQFGAAIHDNIEGYELGAYFVQGIPKTPGVYTSGTKFIIYYPQPVDALAVSGSTVLNSGPFNGAQISGEISGRINQPLISQAIFGPTDVPSFSNTLYAKGDVLDAQLSTNYLTPPLPLMPNGGAVAAEFTWNDVLSVTENKAALVPGNTNMGGAFEGTYTPSWFPLANVEVETPVGWTTTFIGDSKYDGSHAGTGTIDVGALAIINSTLTVGLSYQRYYGAINRQALLDRDFATFYVQKVF
jgi:hypothetical protein